jgi:LPS-assembly lipoprotein
MNPIKRFTFMLCIFLSACGYHLRGQIELPEQMKAVYLQGASQPLFEKFASLLRAGQAELVDAREKAGVIVKISKDRVTRRTLSLSETGRATEFEIYYELFYQLETPDGKPISDEQRLELSRAYFNDQVDILGRENEERVIRDELYRQAVQSMINYARIVVENRGK